MATVGTLAWAHAGGGRLSRNDRLRLMAQAMLTQYSLLRRRIGRRLGFSPPRPDRIDLSSLRVPDSSACKRASELAASLSAPWLVNHCLRTYLWGAILARSGEIRFDEELLFVASALHDLGLSESHNGRMPQVHCFAVEGAFAAGRFAENIAWSAERRDRLAEAIALHLNVRVGLRCGAEAHLLHDATVLDVIGARLRELHPQTAAEVLNRHPRLGFKTEIAAAMQLQSEARPESRAAFLYGMGFKGMIRRSPFEE